MPRLDGLGVLQWVRARFTADELPVVMATARADSDDVVRALDLGANDYVTKPIDFPVLHARIKRLLQQATHRGHAATAMRELSLPKQVRTLASHQCPQCGTLTQDEATSCADCGHPKPPTGWLDIDRERAPLLGEVLAGRYLLDRWLGGGASGAVYRARDSLGGGATHRPRSLEPSPVSARSRQGHRAQRRGTPRRAGEAVVVDTRGDWLGGSGPAEVGAGGLSARAWSVPGS